MDYAYQEVLFFFCLFIIITSFSFLCSFLLPLGVACCCVVAFRSLGFKKTLVLILGSWNKGFLFFSSMGFLVVGNVSGVC